jgi:hypothetical protein
VQSVHHKVRIPSTEFAGIRNISSQPCQEDIFSEELILFFQADTQAENHKMSCMDEIISKNQIASCNIQRARLYLSQSIFFDIKEGHS